MDEEVFHQGWEEVQDLFVMPLQVIATVVQEVLLEDELKEKAFAEDIDPGLDQG